MNRLILQHQKMRAISRILESHAEVFAGQPALLEIKSQFSQQLDDTATLISKRLKPSSTIIKPKQEEQKNFEKEFQLITGMGLLLASNLGSLSLTHLFKSYRSRFRSISAFKKYEFALHIHAELQKHPEEAAAIGLSASRISEFLDLTNNFSKTLDNTDASLFQRRKTASELEKLLSAGHETLRTKIDPLITFLQSSHPELYEEYYMLRGRRFRKKKNSQPVNQHVEIVGTVTNALTGKAVKDAVINLVGFDMATETDADGYYLFEDLPETSFTVSCHCAGYQLPEPVTFQAKAGENLVVDFSLTPAS